MESSNLERADEGCNELLLSLAIAFGVPPRAESNSAATSTLRRSYRRACRARRARTIEGHCVAATSMRYSFDDDCARR